MLEISQGVKDAMDSLFECKNKVNLNCNNYN